MNRLLTYLPGLLLCAFLLSSCNTTKYLDVDEYLLKQNAIVLKSDDKIDNKRRLKYELSTLYEQKVNGKFFFIPREWFYFRTQDPGDTTRLDKWQRRVIAEPPALFDEQKADETAEAMRLYLNYKGYYNAEVYYDENISKKKKVDVTYYAYPRTRFKIDSVSFLPTLPDSTLAMRLKEIKQSTLLDRGKALDGKLYEQEKSRIVKYLRNNGYAYFYPNYFAPLEADTTEVPKRANLYIEIEPPFEDTIHQVYTVGELTIYPNFDITTPAEAYRDTLIEGIQFRLGEEGFIVKPEAILSNIYLKKGKLYRQDDFDRTNRQLGALGIFKFVRIRQSIDESNPNQLNFDIELTINPRFEFGLDFELNYTNRSSTSGEGNLIGISTSPSLSNRNAFGGAELAITNLSAGVEINPNPKDDRFWNTIDLRAQTDLYFPRFIDYLSFWKLHHALPINKKKKAAGDSFYDLLNQEAATRLSASYNYVLLLDFYKYNFLTASYGYDLQATQNHRYLISNLAIDFFQPSTEQAFDEILRANPFLARSFGNQLFVSLLLRDFSYVYNSPVKVSGESSYFSISAETAGTEIWLGNRIYNELSSVRDTFQIGSTKFSQYIRLESDYRYYKQYNPKTSLATRVNIGIARPFGFTSDVPYVKQFYAGGPNDIRAWAARELGPGGHIDSLTQNTENPLLFYQAGDLKLQFNAEYRFNIFWRLNGSLFLDAGNIWTFDEDSTRPGSQFLLRKKTIVGSDGEQMEVGPFYQQMAIGSGVGFRFDFTYFIFRLDLGFKMRYPYELDSGSYWADPADYWKDMNINFGLGMPF